MCHGIFNSGRLLIRRNRAPYRRAPRMITQDVADESVAAPQQLARKALRRIAIVLLLTRTGDAPARASTVHHRA
jgi:hypothetical protein